MYLKATKTTIVYAVASIKRYIIKTSTTVALFVVRYF